MKTNIEVKGVSVDSGLILVGDVDYWAGIKGFDLERLKQDGKLFEIPVGEYHVHAHVYDNDTEYSDPEEDPDDEQPICSVLREDLTITSGYGFAIDPCYCVRGEKFPNAWEQWLFETDHGNTVPSEYAFVIDQMGGDGCYRIVFEFVKQE